MGHAMQQVRRHASPLPQGVEAGYCHNPYSRHEAVTIVAADRHDDGPQKLLHPALINKVAFYAFPREAYPIPSPVDWLEKADMGRVFFGQLPYNITDMELAWLCGDFAQGSQVYHTERIMKKSGAASKQRLPTGCVHTYSDPRDVPMLIEALNKRVLFDDCGIWYAETEAQFRALHEHCRAMKEDASLRPAERPYQPVVVQEAISTYVPNDRDRRVNQTQSPPPAYRF